MAVEIEGTQQLPSPEGAESPHTSDSRKSTLSVRLAEIVILVAACVITFKVQSPYFGSIHLSDDLRHLALVGSLHEGDIGWFEYIMTPYREHFLPVWRIWYYITWSEVGVDPWLWHVGITSVHAFSAVCLFFILRRYLHDLGAAATGSLLWASCSFGRMDNTLNWIAASHFTFGVAWMLAASACLTRFHSKRSLVWAAAMCVSLITAIGSMGSMIILAPLLPLQYWLLERREKPESTHFRAWLVAWLIPVVSLMLVQPALAGSSWSWTFGKVSQFSLFGSFRTAVASISDSLGDLLPIWSQPSSLYDRRSLEQLSIGAMAGCLIAASFWLWDRFNVRLLAVFAIPIGLFIGLIHLSRTDVAHVMSSSRYDYLPTLVWCVSIAALVDCALWAIATPRRRWPVYVGLVCLLVLIVPRQTQRAQLASNVWENYIQLYKEHFYGYPVLFSKLAESADDQAITVVLPDIELEFPISRESGVHLRQDLSKYLPWSIPDGLPQIEVVRKSEVTPGEVARSLMLLAELDHPLAPYLSDRIQGAVEQQQ